MGDVVDYNVSDGIAELVVNNPPVNALGHALRSALFDRIVQADADMAVRAIVIRAAGNTFPAGADIAEFGKTALEPTLPDLCNRVEACGKPVIAALHGTALGGGFELALAAHYRIAPKSARIGLPETTLGIIPGAGGTQRVPRIVGAHAALELMVSGKPMRAGEAFGLGLIDAVIDEDVAEGALIFAKGVIAENLGPRPTRDRREGLEDPMGFLDDIKAWKNIVNETDVEAPRRVVECVEAVTMLPFEAGLTLERALFTDLLASDQSAALRHAFFAERKASKLPELDGITRRPVRTVAVIGGGLMGAGIAVSCLDAGLQVTLIEREHQTLEDGVGRILDIYDSSVGKGRLSANLREERMSRLTGATNYREIAKADLVIEAVSEDEKLKTAVFKRLDEVMKPGAILATNTSYLNIDALAEATGREGDIIGLHFFSPAHVMKLLEVIVGAKTKGDVIATAFEFAKKLSKVPVRAGMADGFIANRVLTAYRTAADFMLEDGASVEEIDAAMRAYGFKMGPYQVLDMAGLDISWARRKRLVGLRDPNARYVTIADQLCEMGRFGRKAGMGYYRYNKGARHGETDPMVGKLVSVARKRAGIKPRSFTRDEIQRRCVWAMMLEGARLVADGVASRPSDVDVVMIHGYGFPRWRGGPMKAADLAGLTRVKRDIDQFAKEEPKFWNAPMMIGELIKNGDNFDFLNRA